VVLRAISRHNWNDINSLENVNFYTCFDTKGDLIARCQTEEEIKVLRRMGRPIAEIKTMKNEEAVVCSLTGLSYNYNEEY
tara:strand:+ start:767 stop:1006 length:240 start_codon:yes stop_codon:yes gene_type:complete